MSFDSGSQCASIGDYAFGYSGLVNIAIPASVTSIGEYAFSSCSDLTSVELSCASLVSINSAAFANSALTSISLPPGAFYDGAVSTSLKTCPCPVGSYSSNGKDDVSCVSCKVGYSTATTGTVGTDPSVCTLCAVGYYSSNGHASGTNVGCTSLSLIHI